MQEQLPRTRSFQCIEFKKLFFLRDLRAFVVNAFDFVLKRILSQPLERGNYSGRWGIYYELRYLIASCI